MSDELDDLLGPGAYQPDLAPHDPEPVWMVVEGSSNVAEIIYWYNHSGPDSASMGMRFLSGREYHYWGIPESVYVAIVEAESRGESHWELVRRRGYHFKRQTDWR